MNARLRKQVADIFHSRATRLVVIQTKNHILTFEQIQPFHLETPHTGNPHRIDLLS